MRVRCVAIACFMFFAGCSLILACGFATGHFHQVTAIRGRVVGKNLGPLQFRWLRRSFSIGGATLTLYEYHSPANKESLRRAAVTTTDSHGRFDFGSVPQGHYSLDVTVKDSDVMGAWFDLEVTDKVKATETILLDASPIEPDCTGGHEFIEKKANATKN